MANSEERTRVNAILKALLQLPENNIIGIMKHVFQLEHKRPMNDSELEYARGCEQSLNDLFGKASVGKCQKK